MPIEVVRSLLRNFLEKNIYNSSSFLELYEKDFNNLLSKKDFYFDLDFSVLEKILQKITPKVVSEFSQNINYSSKDYECTFINGIFQSNRSYLPEGTTVLSLNEAKNTFASFFELQKDRWKEKEKKLFFLLNKIASQEGIFLFFPKFLKKPINFTLKNIVNDPLSMATPCLHILVGNGVSVNMNIEQDFSISKELFLNGIIDVFLGINSSLIISQKNHSLQKCNLFKFWSIRATLSERASFSSYFLDEARDNSIIYYDLHLLLEGMFSSACIQSGISLKEKAEGIVKVQIDHLGSNTSSIQTIKAIVDDEAKNSFEGGIFISPEAQKADAYQKFSGLMLAEKSFIKASPQLKILADDVKASHGASIKQLEEDLIFYLKTRGLSQIYAEQLLIESFFNDLVLNAF